MSKPDEVVAELKVLLHKNGSVSVSGPLQERLLIYGLFEMGKANFTHHCNMMDIKAAQKQIAIPSNPQDLLNKLKV